MNREIEFRAWLKAYKQMTKVLNIDFKLNAVHIPKIGMSYSMQFFEDIELMQYTGLEDKNGVKIFEGDIMKIWYDFETEYYEQKTLVSKGVVKFDKGMFTVKFEGYNYYINADGLKLEVIGNIYENKELLGDKNE